MTPSLHFARLDFSRRKTDNVQDTCPTVSLFRLASHAECRKRIGREEERESRKELRPSEAFVPDLSRRLHWVVHTYACDERGDQEKRKTICRKSSCIAPSLRTYEKLNWPCERMEVDSVREGVRKEGRKE